MTLDVGRVRAAFPALDLGVAHFDGPGGSQVPRVVADAVARTLVSGISNRGAVTDAERRADDAVLGARAGGRRPARRRPGRGGLRPVDDPDHVRRGACAREGLGHPATRSS